MPLVEVLSENLALWVFVVTILGLAVGSFLNVVIHRLPIMMERDWRNQCAEFLNAPNESVAKEKFNLATPRSRCPKCGHRITARENIPVISYLLLHGRCSSCQTKISIRYPLIEATTGLLSAVVAWRFGFGVEGISALILTWALIALTVIDFDHQLLPDDISLPLLWVGLLLSINGLFVDTQSSIIGAVAGYLSLWSVYKLFKWATGKDGMGYGDFKLLAMLGAWLGWQALPGIILLSSAVGAVVGIGLIIFARRDRSIPIPFGPYLATAGWIYLIWGDQLSQYYLSLSGIR